MSNTPPGGAGARRSSAGLLADPAASLPLPPADDRTTWSAAHLDRPTLSRLRERADDDLAAPWPLPLASGFARYARDGDRAGYESAVFARQHRLSRAAVMAAATLDARWLDEVADGVTLLCEQSTWCWPAHDDTFGRGAVVPDLARPYLDLGAGEVAAQLAWIDHLLGSRLDERYPGLRARIRHEVDHRVLTPFTTRRDWHWLGLHGDVHNWSAWIHGNVLTAGLALMADGEPRTRLVDLAVGGLDRYLASIPPDGAIDEGFLYWWQGACRALEALDVLHHASGGALGGDLTGPVRATIGFPHRMHLGGDWYFNVADSAARVSPEQPWDALHRAARRAGDRTAEAHAAAQRRPQAPVAREEGGLGRLLRALTDPAWIGAAPAAPPLPRDVWLPSTQVFLARSAPGTAAGLTLAVKGGHNGEHHNHNDVGAVVVALGGVPVVVDPGRPTYTAQTFGPDRYDIWTMQSSWHSVPEIRDTAQAVGPQYAARDVEVRTDDDGAALALDIAGAYPRSDVAGWRREARLDRRDGRVSVSESWTMDPCPGPQGTRVHLMVAGTVRTGPGHAVVTALEGAGAVRISWEPADLPCSTTVRPLDDPLLRDVWGERLTRLEIDVSALGPVGALRWSLEEVPAGP
ncbi:heparinase II/III family protein [Kitasatospora sp. NPDC057015]|uniref:heparinase II/III domain-containing protein n=1 Tax=Kitasatospora sp. NPDC057015 TaxID=3346001 RepID=UPI0036359623